MNRPHWICVSNADSGQLIVLRRRSDAGLDIHHTLDLGGQLMPMAHSPGGARLYVARRSEPWAVITLALDQISGRLSVLGETALPASVAYLSLDVSGRFLFAASYHSHLLVVSSIRPDGQVAPAHQIVPTGAHAHCVVASPCNRYVLASCLGSDEVRQYPFDSLGGRLMEAQQTAWRADSGSGPRHLRFFGDRVYLLNELNATVQVLSFDAQEGRLALLQTESILPPGFTGKPWAADLCLTPEGQLLVCSERTSSTLAVFSVSSEGLPLRKLGHAQTEEQPRGIAICAPDQLLVVGQLSNHLSSYRIDLPDGVLRLQQRLPMGRNPNWIEVMSS
jgi:6-phosphogluconolactonase